MAREGGGGGILPLALDAPKLDRAQPKLDPSPALHPALVACIAQQTLVVSMSESRVCGQPETSTELGVVNTGSQLSLMWSTEGIN